MPTRRTAPSTPRNTPFLPSSRRGGERPRNLRIRPNRPPICARGSSINGAALATRSPSARSPRSSATPWTPSAAGSIAAGCNPSRQMARTTFPNRGLSTSPAPTATASPSRAPSTKSCWMPSSGRKTNNKGLANASPVYRLECKKVLLEDVEGKNVYDLGVKCL